ncbi:hypothetical protein JTB14_006412 [Gonioctena quinquepunctata]|nr:hypothetical protein JTB14_006412 [Gonioctena quinquepunctata]
MTTTQTFHLCHQCQYPVLFHPHQKKNKFNEIETEETAKSSTAELQRLVLLEQMQLTWMQIEREQIMLNRLRETPMEWSNYVVDVNSGEVYAYM